MAFDIAKKIKTLVAKAASTVHEAEAVTIMQKVRVMLDQHGMSLTTIMETADSDDPVRTEWRVAAIWASDSWGIKLASAVAMYYDVRLFSYKVGNCTDLHVIGRESCIAAFTAMYPYFAKCVRKKARVGVNEKRYTTVSVANRMIAQVLTYRLEVAAYERLRETPQPVVAAGRGMLVPVDAIEAQIKESFPKATTAKRRASEKAVSPAALTDGYSINISDQVSDETERVRLG